MAEETNLGDTTVAEELAPLRVEIDSIDDRLIELLNDRARVAQRVGEVKSRSQRVAYAPERENQLLQRVDRINPGPISPDGLRSIYKEIISASLALEAPLQVAYLGPEATFSHEATKRHFGMSAQLAPCATVAEVFADVSRGRRDYGVVPVESSSEGIVDHTLDALMHTEISICAEVLFEVRHHLLVRDAESASIEKIYATTQALARCHSWLAQNLPGVAKIDVASARKAAELAAADPTAAAVGGSLAARLFDLQVVARGLEQVSGNLTRFLVIGRNGPAPSGHDLTSVMFALRDEPGVLSAALTVFADARINISRIQSRPSQRRAWDYLFFVDVAGHGADPTVAAAIDQLDDKSEFVKILGSYPKGTLPAGEGR